MSNTVMLLLLNLVFILPFTEGYTVPETNQTTNITQTQSTQPLPPFEAFTGKIIKNKVRLRQQPSLEGAIVRELNVGDLLVIIGETDDFYSVQPPADVRGYVFRTYVLDNVVEGNKVNVRLSPDVDAPVIAQLAAGDKVSGFVSPINNKWLEILPPSSTRFYIAKDYIKKIGDAAFIITFEKRKEEVNTLLNSTNTASKNEMNKSFPDINLDGIYSNYNKIITGYSDFPDQAARAREQFARLQDDYLQKKLIFLEAKSKYAHEEWQNKNSDLNQQVKNQQQKLNQLEQQLKTKGSTNIRTSIDNAGLSNKMAAWIPTEQNLYNTWLQQHNGGTKEEFYTEQTNQAITLTGLLEPFIRVIKNKPGDFMIVNPANNLTIAYLYSTQVDMQERIGQNVTIRAIPRPNNNFAFPAYFVISIE